MSCLRGVLLPLNFSILMVCLALTGCGTAYVSPRVQAVVDDTDDKQIVTIIALTTKAARLANKSAYQPRRLPPIFNHVTAKPVSQPLPPALAAPLAAPAEAMVPVLSAPPEVTPRPYTIGISDVIFLSAPTAGQSVEELSGLLAAQTKRQGYAVQDDGAIAVPDVGRIALEGLNLKEAEAAVFQALVSGGYDPAFSIEVSEFNSQRVSVGGAVNAPKLLPITLTPLRLDEALQLAGGISASEAGSTTIHIFRGGKLFKIPMVDFQKTASLRRLVLQDGDSLFVEPTYNLGHAQAYFEEQVKLLSLQTAARTIALAEVRSEFEIHRSQQSDARANFTARAAHDAVVRDYVYLSGEIAAPGRFVLPFEQRATLADALFSSSGISSGKGNPAAIYLLRANRSGETVIAYHLDARNVANMVVATQLELRPNDIIFVAEQPVTAWSRLLSQIGTSLVLAGATRAIN